MLDDHSCGHKWPVGGAHHKSTTFSTHCSASCSLHPRTSLSDPSTQAKKSQSQAYTIHTGRILNVHGVQAAQTVVQSVEAVQAISRMRGGAQSQLILGDDRNLWVVKFANNPQHFKILANELIATQMAKAIGLSVPMSTVINVSQWLVKSSPQLYIDHGPKGHEPCSSGLQFGSRFAGGLMPRQVIDYLPDELLQSVRNLEQFAGVLAFDKWTGNSDARQAVFRRTAKERDYTAMFIDQGFCFNAGEWTFPDIPWQGVFARNSVYSEVTGWDSFDPWLNRIEQFDTDTLWNIVELVPPEWYGNNLFQLEELIETLLRRRSRVREMISQFRQSSRAPFPNWKNAAKMYGIPRQQPRRRSRTHDIRNNRQSVAPIYASLSPTLGLSESDSKFATITPLLNARHNRLFSAELERWLIQHSF